MVSYRLIKNSVLMLCTTLYCFFIWHYLASVKKVEKLRIQKAPKRHRFQFRSFYNNVEVVGKPFDIKWEPILTKFNLHFKWKDDAAVMNSEPKIVTAFSDNHFNEAVVVGKNLIKLYGLKKLIYVYDIGLNDENKENFSTMFTDIIIQFRTFDFDSYPSYVKNLFEYRWKPIIVAEMLNEFDSIWWVDSSDYNMVLPETIRYNHLANCTEPCRYYPWVLPYAWGHHNIFVATDRRMFDYLPFPVQFQKRLIMYGANLMLIHGTNRVRSEILRYLLLCALEYDCMAPLNSTIHCHFNGTKWAKCHRFDQSAVNVLLGWANAFDVNKFTHHGNVEFRAIVKDI